MDEKKLIQSKTFWGGVIMLANGVAKHLGYDLGDQAAWVDILVNLSGAVLAIWGRITATKRIKSMV
jgi:hypothetical protein